MTSRLAALCVDAGSEVDGPALELGARHLDVGQRPEEGHVVLADPDGNEFCVLRAFTPDELAEVEAAAQR